MVHCRCKNLQKVRPPPPSFFTMKFLYSCIMPYKLYFFFSSSEISIPKSSIEYPACGWCWCLFLADLVSLERCGSSSMNSPFGGYYRWCLWQLFLGLHEHAGGHLLTAVMISELLVQHPMMVPICVKVGPEMFLYIFIYI